MAFGKMEVADLGKKNGFVKEWTNNCGRSVIKRERKQRKWDSG